MTHAPRHATTYSLVVDDEETAREGAQALAARGHALVRVAPAPGSAWRIDSLDEGPYPDDDEDWWTSAEERAVSELTEDLGGTVRRSMALPETARRFFPDGEPICDLTIGQVRDARLTALSSEPARAPRPIIVHDLGNPEPSGGPTGERITLQGLEDIDWASLTGAYGPADEIPDILRGLAANDEGWDEAMEVYFSSVVHQDTCYSCTPETIRFLVQVARAPQLTPEYRVELLAHLTYIATIDPVPVTEKADADESATCQAVIDQVPALLALWPDASATVRAWLIVLAAQRPETGLLPEFRDLRSRVEGASPALDLALALVSGDDEGVLEMTMAAASWDEEVPPLLEAPLPLRSRHLTLLTHLALTELTPAN
ncbi:hypothetical protein E1293_31130 [Actinomadura darangshiensis]|uniref:Uncharacterized protein n=1 Tax=Actinomadura darangshiensis TaxID=705336 RepID=A0A4R5ANA5_9ACTN|nr:hypothetical protein [Actinomadura darangshiensis]TDD73515.1 hypothetical protein E1293_31130 [Actinomadura darangshiensis]